MSRGLSQQQRLILGLAVAMSRHHYGQPKAHTPQVDPAWRVPVAFTATVPDVTTALATHIVHGVTIEHHKHSRIKNYTNGAFTLTPDTKAAKNSTSRSITILLGRGLLVCRPSRRGEDRRAVQWGYLLTPAGLDVGAQYEVDLPADMDHRLVAFDWLPVRDRLGCGAWSYDESIPLTFKHPKLLVTGNGGRSPTDTRGGAKCLRGSDREPHQHLDAGGADALTVGEVPISAPPTDSRGKCLRGARGAQHQHIDDAVILREVVR